MDSAVLGLSASLFTALAQSAADVSVKAATREAETPVILATQWCVSALLLAGLCGVAHPELVRDPLLGMAALSQPGFGALVVVSGILNVVAYYFLIRAFRLSDASLVAPLALLTPVLMLLTSPLMVREQASPLGALGVAVIVLGAVLIGATEPGASKRASALALLRDPGARAMMLTAAIWSVTANIDKLGVRASTPLLWIASITAFIALCAVFFCMATVRHRPALGELRFAIASGTANALGNAAQMYALTVLLTPYVIAVKRMSALFTVVLSGFALKENIRGRLLGVAVMLCGAALIALAQ
jgi:drug/metabolite transporter (DMT)-like permease